MIKDTLKLLQTFRSDEKFIEIFGEAQVLANSLDVELKIPRTQTGKLKTVSFCEEVAGDMKKSLTYA